MLQNYHIFKFIFLLALYLSANATASENDHEGSSEKTKRMLDFGKINEPDETTNSIIKTLESNAESPRTETDTVTTSKALAKILEIKNEISKNQPGFILII